MLLSKHLFNLSTSIYPLVFIISKSSLVHSSITSAWINGIASLVIYLHHLLPRSNPSLHCYEIQT